MVSTTPPFMFSPAEQRALELYDKLRELQLQLALLKARQEHIPNSSPESSERVGLQTRLLDAKAAFALRNEVFENVVIVEPTLKAVHNATHASPVERDLLPHIQQRERANAEEAKHHRAVQEATKSLDDFEVEGRQIGRRNGALAAELLQLTENNRGPVTKASYGRQFAGEITKLEQEIKMSRKKWKFMKGAASAIVAGSGIDWVRDERLRSLVLDSTEDEAVATT